ncbi:hypothetical protein [Streptomyces tsukubensis]|uniref:hypothetical protein n=1 Tax=Streptomyces tsukubensis TaxID=83656 RepID=UPI00344E432D
MTTHPEYRIGARYRDADGDVWEAREAADYAHAMYHVEWSHGGQIWGVGSVRAWDDVLDCYGPLTMVSDGDSDSAVFDALRDIARSIERLADVLAESRRG